MESIEVPPKVVRRRWTEDEDKYLLEQTLQFQRMKKPVHWTDIARGLKNRTNKDCRKRYVKICPQFARGSWQADEDDRLRKAVGKCEGKWKMVSDIVQTRSPDQCAKRWRNSLDPGLNRSPFSAEDDIILLQAVQSKGRNWKVIQQVYLPFRSRLDLSNRYTVIHPKLSDVGWNSQVGSMSDRSSVISESTTAPSTPSSRDVQAYSTSDWECSKPQLQLPVPAQLMMSHPPINTSLNQQIPTTVEVKQPEWYTADDSVTHTGSNTTYMQDLAYPAYYQHHWTSEKLHVPAVQSYASNMQASHHLSMMDAGPSAKLERTYSTSPKLQLQPLVPLSSHHQLLHQHDASPIVQGSGVGLLQQGSPMLLPCSLQSHLSLVKSSPTSRVTLQINNLDQTPRYHLFNETTFNHRLSDQS